MKCLATRFVGYWHPSGIESSPGLELVVVECPDNRMEAIALCCGKGAVYVMPLVPDPPAPEPAESEPELALEPPPPSRPAYKRRLIAGKGYAGGRVRRTAP